MLALFCSSRSKQVVQVVQVCLEVGISCFGKTRPGKVLLGETDCCNMQTYSSDSAVRSNDYSEDTMHSTSTSFLMAQR